MKSEIATILLPSASALGGSDAAVLSVFARPTKQMFMETLGKTGSSLFHISQPCNSCKKTLLCKYVRRRRIYVSLIKKVTV